MSPLNDNYPQCKCGTLGCRHSHWPLFVDGDQTLPARYKIIGKGKLDTKRTKWTGMKLFYVKRYTRRVWWALCDLGTVIRGGDPS